MHLSFALEKEHYLQNCVSMISPGWFVRMYIIDWILIMPCFKKKRLPGFVFL